MSDINLSEGDIYSFGRYGIGRRGYRPVVTLPKRHALRLSELKDYAEILGLVLFVISVVLFFINTIGDIFPRVIGVILIGFRVFTIILSHSVIAKTVVREFREYGDGGQVKGNTTSSLRTDIIHTRAQVIESELHIWFQHYRRSFTSLNIEIGSQSGVITPNETERQVELPPAEVGNQSEIELTFDLNTITPRKDQTDTLVVSLERSFLGPEHFQRMGELTIPVRISGKNQMASKVIKKEFEVLNS